jgi:hypothetical protein
MAGVPANFTRDRRSGAMGAYRDRGVLIACIGATSAIVAASAKPICSVLFEEEEPRTIVAVAEDYRGARTTPFADSGRATRSDSGRGVRGRDDAITPTASVPTIEGAWKQYVLVGGAEAMYLGTFVVSRYKGEWVMSPRTQGEGEYMVNTLGIFDVAYDGERWTFNSKWGHDQGVGNFELKRVSPTVCEGEIRIAGQLSNRTRWVKIE